ncbi:TetR/AcrR family transcriptional regulator C-terminal domain-containing protein [Acidisoma sp. 7E03]
MSGTDNTNATDADAPAEALSPERRQAILDGAGRVFARDGYEGASMARIAREVGVSKGTLYNYFPSKAALFHGVISTSCDSAFRHLLPDAQSLDSAETTLRSLGLTIVEMMVSPFRRAIHTMVMSEAEKFPELARIFYEAGPQRALTYLAGWLRQQTEAGHFTIVDADFAAEQFVALCQTKLVMRARLRLAEPTPAEVERVVQGAIAVFLAAYGVPTQGEKT